MDNDKINFFILNEILSVFEQEEWNMIVDIQKSMERLTPRNENKDLFEYYKTDKNFIRDSYTSWIKSAGDYQEFRRTYNMYYFETNNDSMLDFIVKSYFKTFAWVWKYYKYGVLPDWGWHYQFSEAPLLADILYYCRNYPNEDIYTFMPKYNVNSENYHNMVGAQLISILPATDDNYKVVKEYMSRFKLKHDSEIKLEDVDYKKIKQNRQFCCFQYEIEYDIPDIRFDNNYANIH
jgi:hypothetical protein